MKRAALLLGALVAACGTEEWSFFDPGAGKSTDAGTRAGVDADADASAGLGVDAGESVGAGPGPGADADASADSGCDVESGPCPIPCSGDADCPSTAPVCEQRTFCGPCQSNVDCEAVRAGPICGRNGACLPECFGDRNCPSTRPTCDRSIGRCVR
jgi:hypothetical protein